MQRKPTIKKLHVINKSLKLNKHKNKIPLRNQNDEIIFKDYPDFTPNLSPNEIFTLGSFGGTYWRPIYSSVNNIYYSDVHKQSNLKQLFDGIPEEMLSTSWKEYNKNINQYRVKVGATLEDWENSNWIYFEHPYGWIHWYCCFYQGYRSKDDERQIKRWKAIAGPNGRFRKFLINLIYKKNAKWNDYTISPKIRQILQHWGYILTEKDFLET